MSTPVSYTTTDRFMLQTLFYAMFVLFGVRCGDVIGDVLKGTSEHGPASELPLESTVAPAQANPIVDK